MKKKKGHQRSRLRVDPFNLLQQLCEHDCTLSELQQRTGFDPAEIKPLRAAGKIHLDTLNRIAAGLDVSPNSLLSPSRKNGQEKCEKSRMKQTGANESKVKRQKLHTAAFQNRRAISIQSKSEDELCCRKLQYKQRYRSVPPAWSGSGADEPAHISDS